MNADPTADLAEYFERRRQAARDRVAALLEPLTAREISLIRDAAVMAFVRGRMHGRYERDVPRDADIMTDVVYALTHETEGYDVIRGEAYEYSDVKP